MPFLITQVAAFTHRPLSGNPAAVCLLPSRRDADWMQKVAREMNVSETAFLVRRDAGFDLRWFTPTVEVDLCGHATLASAHVLWESGELPAQEVAQFHTRSGVLLAHRTGEWIEMDFPSTPPTPLDVPPEGLGEALGVIPTFVGKSRFHYLVEVASEETLRKLKPDFGALASFATSGVIVTARSSTPPYDFVSRYFAPAKGVDEDPVTGSAHCCLGPFWQLRLNRAEFLAYQASDRGGEIRVRVAGKRTYLSGKAVTVMQCEMLIL